MKVKVPTFKCPHCNNDLGTAVNAHLYGSPIRICAKCRNTYVDRRYHEIAIEGVQQLDVNPTTEDKKSNIKRGFSLLGLGIAAIALFILILATGWMVFPLPIIGGILIASGIGFFKENSKKSIESKQKEIEIERQQSELRLKNPEYVKQLKDIGYISDDFNAAPPQQTVCSNCRTVLDGTDKFCPKCGTKN